MFIWCLLSSSPTFSLLCWKPLVSSSTCSSDFLLGFSDGMVVGRCRRRHTILLYMVGLWVHHSFIFLPSRCVQAEIGKHACFTICTSQLAQAQSNWQDCRKKRSTYQAKHAPFHFILGGPHHIGPRPCGGHHHHYNPFWRRYLWDVAPCSFLGMLEFCLWIGPSLCQKDQMSLGWLPLEVLGRNRTVCSLRLFLFGGCRHDSAFGRHGLLSDRAEAHRDSDGDEPWTKGWRTGQAKNVGIVSSIMTHCSRLLCCCFVETKRQSAVEKILEIQDKVEKLSRSPYGAFGQGLLSLFPLFYQEESPFRAKWYEVTFCVVLWLSSLMRTQRVKLSGIDNHTVERLTLGIEILSTGWAAFRVSELVLGLLARVVRALWSHRDRDPHGIARVDALLGLVFCLLYSWYGLAKVRVGKLSSTKNCPNPIWNQDGGTWNRKKIRWTEGSGAIGSCLMTDLPCPPTVVYHWLTRIFRPQLHHLDLLGLELQPPSPMSRFCPSHLWQIST